MTPLSCSQGTSSRKVCSASRGHAFNQQVAGEIVELHRDVARAISHRSVYSLTSTVGRFRRRRTALYWLPTAPNTAYSARDTRSYPFVRKPGNRLP